MIKVPHIKNTSFPQFEVPEKNDDKKSVPRKGVTFTDAKNATSTTIKPKKKKPTITEADDVPFVPSSFKSNETGNHGIGIEAITEKQKKPDYVVPIVVVILLVPLVAIVISILYKRGAEWWQHRHYRRMDFLIEGMYNN
ncbi:hypothetical protein BDFB_001444 [Asbolus verrucosus]|uniref:Uncharacterized protein n=1 Tax=Asbolus verrucosus TaxID=1661398 RepID=A0A482VAY6_ASBVE|nr:hypothetical protein BDFB_001444 [Asbolus verrucosus]